MDCRELEDRLEALLDGELVEPEQGRCTRHLAECPTCRELAEPLLAATVPPEDLVGAVLAGTSGPSCGRAELLLDDWLDRRLGATDRELVAAHLDCCGQCRLLAAAMTRLRAELPLLAELRPGPGFVAAVLAATLPPSVRLRRWWAASWPRWVRRRRFASEAAFIATMVIVLIFATPGSPLEAVPARALELARSDAGARLEAPVSALEQRFATQVQEPLSAGLKRGRTVARGWAGAAAARGRQLMTTASAWLGTSRELLASLLGSADKEASEPDDTENPNQEKP